MFFRILRKELKRKKTLNIILFLFITMATMFLASSVCNLVTVTDAVDHFIEISNVPDNFVIAIAEGQKDSIEEYLKTSADITEYGIMDGFNINNDRISIVKSKKNNKKYQRLNSLALQPVPNDFMKVFDLQGYPLSLKKGEIALSRLEAKENQLAVGDKVKITVGEIEQEFTVAALVKDVVFGNNMMGFKRHFISQEDFDAYANQEELTYTRTYSINYENEEMFKRHWQEQNFSILSSVEKSVVSMCYVFDMLTSAILIIVSICLILIAFFVLRFTILFTLQGDFREIGIMKAIGLQDRGIAGIYMIKYLMIAAAGAAVGWGLSVPFGKMLLEQVVVNLVVTEKQQSGIISILCAVGIVSIVLLFAAFCTGKLKKFSAIDAIRSGETGERYQATNTLKLWKRKYMKPGFYMAYNDILSNPKRFLTLGITFCVGTLLILLPLSAIHTLKSDNIVELFSMASSDVYLDNGKTDDYLARKSTSFLEADLKEIEDTLKQEGITAKTGVDVGYSIPCYGSDKEEIETYFTLQEVGSWDRSYTVLEGREPEAEDEIMLTEITAEELKVSIGDTITYVYPDREQEYIITGTYQSMMNLGQGFRVSRKAELEEEYFSGMFCVQVEVPEMESEEAYQKIKEIFPDYNVMQADGFLGIMIASVTEQLDELMILITVLVLAINSLITILTMKIMFSKERGDIALLKSIGFKNRTIRKWQVIRILLILVTSIFIGTILSKILAPVIIGPIFAMMGGTQVRLVEKPIETYVLYPAILLIVTGISGIFGTLEIGKVDVKEVNVE